ncbi:MAG: S8 family serine peptidase [Saprospiraceae bacterium]|nr:S8 family serine peptidase [Saprospiraceae bacterium]
MISTGIIFLGFALAAIALPLWFFQQSSGKSSSIMRNLLWVGLGAYAIGAVMSPAAMDVKFSGAFRDFLVLAVIGLGANFLVKNRILFILASIAGVFALGVYYKNILVPSFSVNATSSTALELAKDAELLVELAPNSDLEKFNKVLGKYGMVAQSAFAPASADMTELDDYLVVDIPQNQLANISAIKQELNDTGIVDWIEENEMVTFDDPVQSNKVNRINKKFGINDPDVEKLWSFEAMEMDKLYNYIETKNVKPKKKALIAILDTGVDAKHEDLSANYKSFRGKYDDDPRGHGTHCAGIAAAVSNNGIGVASYSRDNRFAQVASIKVLSASGMGTQQTIIKGIIEAADKGADVISMSLGGLSTTSRQKAYTKAVKYALDKGAIVLAAAGNSNRNAKDYAPVNAKGVIGVSAVDANLNRAVFSNYVQDINMGIAAPGVDIYSTKPSNKYAIHSGTSMATPYAAGLVGVMKSIKPSLTSKEAYQILSKTGKSTKANAETGKFIYPYAAIKTLVEQ